MESLLIGVGLGISYIGVFIGGVYLRNTLDRGGVGPPRKQVKVVYPHLRPENPGQVLRDLTEAEAVTRFNAAEGSVGSISPADIDLARAKMMRGNGDAFSR